MSTDAVTIRILADNSQASAALKETGDQAEASLGADGQLGTASKEGGESLEQAGADAEENLGADGKLGKSAEEGEEGLDNASGATGGLMSNMKMLGGMAVAFAGAAVVAKVGGAIYDAFNDDQKATAALSVAMKDAGEKVTPAFTASLDKLQSSGERLGFASADTTSAMTALTVAGVSSTQAVAAMRAIYDLAAARHTSLADAASAVVKGMQGEGRAFKDLNVTMPATLPTTTQLTSAQTAYNNAVTKYGPASTQATTAHQKLADIQAALADRTKNLGDITDILTKKLGGQASAAAQTFSGRLDALKVEFVDWGAKVLTAVVPVVTTVLEWIMSVIPEIAHWVESLHGLWAVVGQVFGDIKTIVGDVVGWISDHWNTIRDDTEVAWNVISTIIKIAVTILYDVISTGIGIIVDVLKVAWDVISTVIGTAITVIIGIVRGVAAVVGILTGIWRTVTSDVSGFVSGFIGFFTSLPGKIGTAITGVAGMITGPFKAAFDAVAGLWNNTLGAVSFQVPGWIPGIGGDKFGFPKIPTFHDGGVVPGTPGSEVFARLLAGEAVLSPSATRSLMSGGGAAAGAGGATVYLTAITTSDPNAISRSVVSGLRTGSR